MTPSPVTSQATTQSSNHTRGPATPQTPGSHTNPKGAAERTQHSSSLSQPPVSGNADSIAADLEHDNLPDDFNFGVLEDHGGGTDGVEGALDVSKQFSCLMDCSYDSDSCERKSLFCSEPLQTFGLALGCSACLKASYHSNCVRARKNGLFSSLCQCCLHVRRSKDRRLTLAMHRILTLSVVTIL